MVWYTFDERQKHELAPNFHLSSGRGEEVTRANYQGRANLVLLFLPRTRAPEALRAFAARQKDYAAEEARVLAIIDCRQEELDTLSDGQPTPFPLLADPESLVRRQYVGLAPLEAGADDTLIFVLDRYGAPYAASAVADPAEAKLQEEILEWLGFIEVQCPECGVAEWPDSPSPD